jgi:serine/threonine-protein kinase
MLPAPTPVVADAIHGDRHHRDDIAEPVSTMPTRLTLKRVKKLLGRGGLTETFVADVVEIGQRRPREVVVKRLHPNLIDDRAAIARVAEEARVLSRLDSPRIPRLVGVGEDSALPFFAMSHIIGCPLDALGTVAWTETLAVALDLVDALAVAHAADVTHRDVSGKNVLVDVAGRAHLIDFGVARAGDRSRVTRSGAVVGTPAAMAPEQARGEVATSGSDVWAVGVLLFQLLSGQHPLGIVDDDGPAERLRKVKAASVVPLVHPDVPEPLCRLVMSCLTPRAATRPPDARALQVLLLDLDVKVSLAKVRAQLAERVTQTLKAPTSQIPESETLDDVV